MSRRRTRVELRKHRPVVAIVAAVQQGNLPLLAAGYGLGLSQGFAPALIRLLHTHRRLFLRPLDQGQARLFGLLCGCLRILSGFFCINICLFWKIVSPKIFAYKTARFV